MKFCLTLSWCDNLHDPALSLTRLKLSLSSHPISGVYACSECGYELFSSKTKYEHHTPWPAFTNTIHSDSVSKVIEGDPQESSDCRALKVIDRFWRPTPPNASLVSFIMSYMLTKLQRPAFLYTFITFQISCGKCGNPLGHEFLGDGPGGKGSRF